MSYQVLVKPLDDLEEPDLQELVNRQVNEQHRIEYKAVAPRLGSHEEKLEFLADVSSFANASGGIVLYGIREEEGLPLAPIEGIVLEDPDMETRRARQILDDSVRPRMPGLGVAAIQLASGRYVLAVRVARSWCSPHMVKLRSSQRFFARRDNGKMELDVHEIRAAFIGSEREVDRVRDFRLARLASIAAGETPALQQLGPRLVLHLVPLMLGSVGSEQIDLHQIGPDSDHRHFPLLYSQSGWSSDWNFDGFVCSDHPNVGEPCRNYTQVFRTGSIEAVSAYPFSNHGNKGQEVASIQCRMIEEGAVRSVSNYMKILSEAGAQPPMYAMLSLLSVRGRTNAEWLHPGRYWSRDDLPTITRHDLLLPEALFESLDLAPERILRSALDVLWQATGFPASLCWNGDEWNPKC
jgi:hypothetical protein